MTFLTFFIVFIVALFANSVFSKMAMFDTTKQEQEITKAVRKIRS